MVRKHQVIHNQVIPKVHQHGVSSCALHQYDLNGSPHISCTIIINFASFGFNIMNMCVPTIFHSEAFYHPFRRIALTIHSNRNVSLLHSLRGQKECQSKKKKKKKISIHLTIVELCHHRP